MRASVQVVRGRGSFVLAHHTACMPCAQPPQAQARWPVWCISRVVTKGRTRQIWGLCWLVSGYGFPQYSSTLQPIPQFRQIMRPHVEHNHFWIPMAQVRFTVGNPAAYEGPNWRGRVFDTRSYTQRSDRGSDVIMMPRWQSLERGLSESMRVYIHASSPRNCGTPASSPTVAGSTTVITN